MSLGARRRRGGVRRGAHDRHAARRRRSCCASTSGSPPSRSRSPTTPSTSRSRSTRSAWSTGSCSPPTTRTGTSTRPGQTLPRSLSKEDKQRILAGNACRLYGLALMTVAAQVIDCDVHVAPQTRRAAAGAHGRLLGRLRRQRRAAALADDERDLPAGGVPPRRATSPADARGAARRLRGRRAILNCITPFDTSHNAYYEAALCSGVNDWMRTEFLERDPAPAREPRAADAGPGRRGGGDRAARRGTRGSCRCCCRSAPRRRTATRATTAIWEAAERHGLVVGLHAWGRVGNAPTASGFTHSYLEDYASNSQIVVQAHVTSLVSEGVFERFAGLRVALLECGFAWLPFLLWRFDKDWKGVWREVPVGQAAPVGVRARSTSASRPRPRSCRPIQARARPHPRPDAGRPSC